MINFCQIEGNLGSDPLLVTTDKTCFRILNIAQNRRRKNLAGEYENLAPDWYEITLFGKESEFAKNFKKGDRLLIRGILKVIKKNIGGIDCSIIKIVGRDIKKISTLKHVIADDIPEFDTLQEVPF